MTQLNLDPVTLGFGKETKGTWHMTGDDAWAATDGLYVKKTGLPKGSPAPARVIVSITVEWDDPTPEG